MYQRHNYRFFYRPFFETTPACRGGGYCNSRAPPPPLRGMLAVGRQRRQVTNSVSINVPGAVVHTDKKGVLWNETSGLGDSRAEDLIVIECFTTTFLRAHSWLNWVDEEDDDDEVGLKEKPEEPRYIKKITSK